MTSSDLTQILKEVAEDSSKLEKLMPIVYQELRTIASAKLRQERAGHTLLTTDLVHEAYLRLFEGENLEWNDRKHFFASAALAMRRILVDYARRKNAKKRVDPETGLVLKERFGHDSSLSAEEMLDLDEALQELENLDPRQAEVVCLRVFAGLSGKETSDMMGISLRTVAREWWSAKVWLRDRMAG